MDSKIENLHERWDAMRREYEAKAEKLSAEKRLEYNNAFEDFSAEVDAATDWTEASWKEFSAKVDRKWQEMALEMQD